MSCNRRQAMWSASPECPNLTRCLELCSKVCSESQHMSGRPRLDSASGWNPQTIDSTTGSNVLVHAYEWHSRAGRALRRQNSSHKRCHSCLLPAFSARALRNHKAARPPDPPLLGSTCTAAAWNASNFEIIFFNLKVFIKE